EQVVHAANIPVSIKTRLGWDSEHCDWQDLMYVAKESGASFATLHGRTRAQGYTGQAVLPNKPKGLLPIIANGDIQNISDINRVQELGYDGAMIGRAMLGQPWIFGNLCNSCILQVDVGNIVLEHLDLVLQYYGTIAGIPLFRKHMSWYSAGIPKSTEFRVKINKIVDVCELKTAIKDFWHID
ncbi:MAG: tRNA-dihydrouridine synthase, partial [Alphaproteobacteria bacterium]|nr:tRNA-dihydrouridine synthase [Alphaproteobacteria bacterium]